MLQFLRGLSPNRRRRLAPRTRHRNPLRLEELESRTLLSVFTPAQIRHAYGFDQISFAVNGQTYQGDGSGQTIAIVDAYDDPNILRDLKYFDSTFGLPDPAFTKATPQGLPSADAGWAGEIALDVEWAHAMAPQAKILLVEAASDSLSDLLRAVSYARQQTGVVAVSMSWGSDEFYGETSYDGYFSTPSGHLGGSSGLAGASNLAGGITFVASAGDSGAWYGPEWPAAAPSVLSVGGSSLRLTSTGSYSSETAWSGSGGGYSYYEPEPSYQYSVQGSGWRTNPDVAFNADPNTGVYVYDSTNGGWFIVGGTSAGAPQWAALVAIADQGRAVAGKGSLYSSSQTLPALYKMAQSSYATYFHDITSGSNGYSAHAGYDLVTGLGSPRANAIVGALTSVNGSGSTLTFSARTSTTTGTAPAALVTRHFTGMLSTPPEDAIIGLLGTASSARSPGQTMPAARLAPEPGARLFAVPTASGFFTVSDHVPSNGLNGSEGQLSDSAGGDAPADDARQIDQDLEAGILDHSRSELPASAAPNADEAPSSTLPWRETCDACFADESRLSISELQAAVRLRETEERAAAPALMLFTGLAIVLADRRTRAQV